MLTSSFLFTSGCNIAGISVTQAYYALIGEWNTDEAAQHELQPTQPKTFQLQAGIAQLWSRSREDSCSPVRSRQMTHVKSPTTTTSTARRLQQEIRQRIAHQEPTSTGRGRNGLIINVCSTAAYKGRYRDRRTPDGGHISAENTLP